MNIAAGMSGLKAAADLTRSLRDGLKSGTIRAEEVAPRIGEIYDYIIDSKDALVDAKEEIENLKNELATLKETRALQSTLQHDGVVYWLPKGDRWDGPFCSRCWDDERKLIRLKHQRVEGSPDAHFWCPVDRVNLKTRPRPTVVGMNEP